MTPVEEIQSCLAGEHAALYGFGVLGGRLAGVAGGSRWQQLAYAAYDDHRVLRDKLVDVVLDLGAEPVAAEGAYATPFAVRGLTDCRRLAQLLERRCAAVYAAAVAKTDDHVQALLALALQDAAVRGTRWGLRWRRSPAYAADGRLCPAQDLTLR